MTGYDVVVVGAGPAGLAAAAAAARAGCRVAVLDAGPRPGGQFWRHRPDADGRGHHGWSTFARLREQLDTVDHRADAAVWFVEAGRTVAGPAGAEFAVHTRSEVLRGRRLVIATGAHDRVVPFPGWDLPGVVTAGGAQALLKGQGLTFARRIAVAGTGPFLLPVATGLAEAGGTVVGVYEANDPLGYARRLRPVLGAAGKLAEAGRYGWRMLRHTVPYRRRTAVVAAHGTDHLTGVTVAPVGPDGTVVGTGTEVECDGLAVGFGFTPQLELAVTLGCATRLDSDGSLVLAVDAAQATSVPGVYAAGEVTGVGGADLSLVEGELAGGAAALSLGRPPSWSARRHDRLLRDRRRLRRFAAALHAVHPVPAGWPEWCDDDTLVCRCEEVPAGAVRRAVRELSAGDARGAKLLTRAGMGWCQGRVCGYATACLAAREANRDPGVADLSGYASRPLAQPVTLGELAADE
ncbi:FAD/NAD(P)-binding oxidoreductase [Micromonospora sp. NPDC048170]|uniref:FAD/NAD(P)-dependent oxidoreductase n=1 Tax=Micromonospora sp. NPDC048170 TaxID=3154819 RepID=UPI0033E43F93